jgi:divalent metal cation (Fe/Co/Zn/Cd) transporter
MTRPGNSLARAAVTACGCSAAWAAAAGLGSVISGVATGSVALLAFGLESVIDGSASAVLTWRFWRELRHGPVAGSERATARAVGAAMLAAAAYITAQSAWALATGAQPQHTLPAVAPLAASVLVLPLLGTVKVRLASALGSRALRADGLLSLAGAVLAAAALAGLAAGRTLGWWQAGPAAACLIAAFLARAGWSTLTSR